MARASDFQLSRAHRGEMNLSSGRANGIPIKLMDATAPCPGTECPVWDLCPYRYTDEEVEAGQEKARRVKDRQKAYKHIRRCRAIRYYLNDVTKYYFENIEKPTELLYRQIGMILVPLWEVYFRLYLQTRASLSVSMSAAHGEKIDPKLDKFQKVGRDIIRLEKELGIASAMKPGAVPPAPEDAVPIWNPNMTGGK